MFLYMFMVSYYLLLELQNNEPPHRNLQTILFSFLKVDIQLNSFNRTISDMIDLSSVINQSLSKILMDEPIREQASLNQTSTELHSTSERMYITVNSSYVNVTHYLQESTGQSSL